MSHQGPPVGLLLYVNVGAELQPPRARVGVLWLVLGRVGVQTAEDTFGDERKGRRQEVFIDALRRNRERRLERRRGGGSGMG